MEAPLRLIGESENILDLNDDCLKEVFAHIDPEGLAVVADVCVRFRQNSMHSARSKCKKLVLMYGKSSVCEYSMMRNFGAFIERIEVDGSRLYNKCFFTISVSFQEKRFIELLSRYCVGTSIELVLYNMSVTDEIAVLMVPLLAKVRKLELHCSWFSEKFLLNLPLWAPELRELNFHGKVYHIEGLHQKFPELVSIFFQKSVPSRDMEKFLKNNPQLKQVQFVPDDDFEFRLIAMYVPKIEKIRCLWKYRFFYINAEYFGQLRELKSLELITRYSDDTSAQNVIHEIAAANIALEFLKLDGFGLCFLTARFIEGISKLQHLKALHLQDVTNLTAALLIEMCKPFNGLLEIVLVQAQEMSMTGDELLTLVQNTKKLQKLDWTDDGFRSRAMQPSIIDVDTFMKIKAITEQRGEKLTLQLPARVFTADIPEEFISTARGVLSLEIRYKVKSF